MTTQEALDKVLLMYKRYYNIRREGDYTPFAAEADFLSHEEGYFLVKMAKVSENDSAEYVYFATEEILNQERFLELDEAAWTRGTSKANIRYGHKSTDVVLVILADRIDEETEKLIKKQRHYQSYRWGILGFSQYRLVAVDLSSEKVITNRQGDNLKKLLGNIFK